jgi:hypothetical protein
VSPSGFDPPAELPGKAIINTNQLASMTSKTNLVPHRAETEVGLVNDSQTHIPAATQAVPSVRGSNPPNSSLKGWSEIEVAARTPAVPPEAVSSSTETNDSEELAAVPPPPALVEPPRPPGEMPEIPAKTPRIKSPSSGLGQPLSALPPASPVQVPSAPLLSDPNFFQQNGVYFAIMLLASGATVVCFRKWLRSIQRPQETVQAQANSPEAAEPESEPASIPKQRTVSSAAGQ